MSATSADPGDSLLDRIERRMTELPPAERRVADYLRQRSGDILLATAGEIGELTDTSDATVVRTAKALGYSGLLELKRAAGAANLSGRLRHNIEHAGDNTTSLLDHVLAEAVDRLTETRRLLTEADFATAVAMIAQAREVVGFGVGLSELPVRYLQVRLRRLGRPARAVTSSGFRLADDLLPLVADDVVVMVAPERLLPDMETVVDHARSVGARVILISDSLGSVLADRVDLTLTAVHSSSGLSQEGISAMMILDCLLIGVARRDPEQVSRSLRLLTFLRSTLSPGSTRSERRRGRRA